MTEDSPPPVTEKQMMSEERLQTIWQGLMAGLIGYVTLTVLVGVIDLTGGRPFFHTWALLGQRLFYGLTDASQLSISPGPVFAFNGLHLLTFLAIGMASSWLVLLSEKAPGFWYAALILVLLVFFHAFVAMLRITSDLRREIPVALIGVPTAVGAILMMWYLLHEHPRLRDDLRTGREE